MRKHWSLYLVVVLVAITVIAVLMSYPAPSPILRGQHTNIVESLLGNSEEELVETRTDSDPETTSSEEIEILPSRLNLSLPEIDWSDLEWSGIKESYPDFFTHPKTGESRLNFSGKLHWDESEEAETRPLQETITGAELEFKVLLP